MKQASFVVLFLLFVVASCKKEDFVYSYPDTDKLLVAVIWGEADSENRTELKYDNLNRIIEIQNIFQGGSETLESFVYNDKGLLSEKNTGSFEYTYKYNNDGRLIEQNARFIASVYGTFWNQKTEFKYKSGKIDKGIVYSSVYEGIDNEEDVEVENQISYSYDSNGNMLEKNEGYATVKFRYDSKINPLAAFNIQMVSVNSFSLSPDVKQVNNPTSFYYENMAMSCFPPEYEISYEYDLEGFPVKAEIINVRYPEQSPILVEYEYQTKE